MLKYLVQNVLDGVKTEDYCFKFSALWSIIQEYWRMYLEKMKIKVVNTDS